MPDLVLMEHGGSCWPPGTSRRCRRGRQMTSLIPDGEGAGLGVGRWPATAGTLATRKLPDAAVWCRPPRFLASMVRWKGNAAGAGA